MKNKSTQGGCKAVWRLCFSKQRLPFYIMLALFVIPLNLLVIPGLFSSGSDFFGPDAPWQILLLLVSVLLFVGMAIMAPFCLMWECTEAAGREEQPLWVKMLALCLPFWAYLLLQALVLSVCVSLSSHIKTPFMVPVLYVLVLCVVVFLWSLLCLCLCTISKNIKQYAVGFLTLHLAPLVIAEGINTVYESNPLLPPGPLDPLRLVPIVAAVIIGVVLLLRRLLVNRETVSTVYSMILIFLIALSCGFLAARPFLLYTSLAACFFVGVSLATALLFAWLAFRNDRPVRRMIFSCTAVALAVVLILVGVPAVAHKTAYTLPKAEDITRVEISLDSIETFEMDEQIAGCLALHEELLELFKHHKPDERLDVYTEPHCIADLWNDVSFRYVMKDGPWFYRDYRRLNDAAFDAFYISLLQSDVYAYSLQDTQMHRPQMRYSAAGADWAGACELPEICVRELLDTYGAELKNADTAAFYEPYATIRLQGVYKDRDRILYVPQSFSKTRDLANTYAHMYTGA